MKLSSLCCLVGLGLSLATGCTRPEEVPRPANLLSKEEMVGLLVPLHLLEARVENSRLQPDSARALFLSQKRELLWQRHIPLEDSVFERSYRYYATHDKDLSDIYTIVTDSLEAQAHRLGSTQVKLPYR